MEGTLRPYGDNFIPVIPDATPVPIPEHPFCGDSTCICYEDREAIAELDQAIRDGLITPDDATRIMQGKTV